MIRFTPFRPVEQFIEPAEDEEVWFAIRYRHSVHSLLVLISGELKRLGHSVWRTIYDSEAWVFGSFWSGTIYGPPHEHLNDEPDNFGYSPNDYVGGALSIILAEKIAEYPLPEDTETIRHFIVSEYQPPVAWASGIATNLTPNPTFTSYRTRAFAWHLIEHTRLIHARFDENTVEPFEQFVEELENRIPQQHKDPIVLRKNFIVDSKLYHGYQLLGIERLDKSPFED